MKEEISNNLNKPAKLEQLYRNNKSAFKQEFGELYPKIKGDVLADAWHERLNYESSDINWGTGKELLMVIIAALIAGNIAKIPHYFSLNDDLFYPRNIGFIVLPLLTAYFAWKNKLSTPKIALIASVTVGSIYYINSLPYAQKSDTLLLACMHLVLFLWSVLGFAFVGNKVDDQNKRIGFLKYNGDLVVMTGLILIAGGIMSAITVGLFSLIGLRIEEFYFKYVGIFGLAGAPIVGTYLTQTNPQLVGKVSPVIAKLFSPLVLIMLIAYLVAIVYSGKNPYNDREFLMIFNILLIGVMAIIFFSVAETAKTPQTTLQVWVLLLLSIVTILVNGVALSAIVLRITDMGFTPNRTAVLGSNLLILINLLLVTAQLFKILQKKADLSGVERAIALYLPFYAAWTIIVTFLFPLIFGFK
ncbi:MAG: hypothetical protein EOP47_10715 [Sphingobacteriaceae bacterium]|nr:MAG: hypothetical protein EOP47_10715 [Sphingobacteriaceae bacterium]